MEMANYWNENATDTTILRPKNQTILKVIPTKNQNNSKPVQTSSCRDEWLEWQLLAHHRR